MSLALQGLCETVKMQVFSQECVLPEESCQDAPDALKNCRKIFPLGVIKDLRGKRWKNPLSGRVRGL